MSISLFFGRKQPGKIGELELDATISENHDFTNKITKFPVEDGSDISDHIKKDPTKLTISGFITNSPVPILDIAVDNLISSFQKTIGELRRKIYSREKFNRVNTAADLLLQYRDDNIPIDIRTGLFVYTDMYMERLTIPRNRNTGDTLRFSADFVKIETVTPFNVKLKFVGDTRGVTPNILDRAASDSPIGTKNTKDVPFESRLHAITRIVKEKIGK